MATRKKASGRRKQAAVYDEPRFSIALPQVMRDNPLDSFGLFLAAATAMAISANAVLFQDAKVAPRLVIDPPQTAAATPPQRPATPAPAAPAAAQTRAEDPGITIREVQAELSRRGLYDGPADGQFGPKTEAAILDYEIGAGLKPTGKPSVQLLASMRTTSQPAITASPRVQAVQRVLDQQGFGPVKADGVAGEATRAAIRRFEASRGLPQKGEITPAMLRELTKVSSARFD